jgi:hypothetical protein
MAVARADGVGQWLVRHDGVEQGAVHRLGGGAQRPQLDDVCHLAAFEPDDD